MVYIVQLSSRVRLFRTTAQIIFQEDMGEVSQLTHDNFVSSLMQ